MQASTLLCPNVRSISFGHLEVDQPETTPAVSLPQEEGFSLTSATAYYGLSGGPVFVMDPDNGCFGCIIESGDVCAIHLWNYQAD
jgi:hypothetical protein